MKPSLPLCPVPGFIAPLALVVAGFAGLIASPASAQTDRSIALPAAEVEELDSASAAHLENARRFVEESQWVEAVEAIRRVQEADSQRLVEVEPGLQLKGFQRYVPASEFCQWRLAALAEEAPAALDHYRSLIDPLAAEWLERGARQNDAALLSRVVRQAFASSSADEALLKLGDLALAQGRHALARSYWERIAPQLTVSPSAAQALQAAVGSPLWLPLRSFDFDRHSPELKALLEKPTSSFPGCYPDSDLDLAAVRARLVLCSILEGSPERAKVELQVLRLLHPDAQGNLAGRSGRFTDLLQALQAESAAWERASAPPAWHTFAGSEARAGQADREVDPAGQPLWVFQLPRLSGERDFVGDGRLRVAEDARALQSYHPIVVGNQVLLRLDARGRSYVLALDSKTGRTLWEVDYSRSGARPTDAPEAPPTTAGDPFTVSDAHSDLARHMGVARFTLSAHQGKLFATIGSSITIPSQRRLDRWLPQDQGKLVGLDLQTQGKPLEGFPLHADGTDWTFDGTPLFDGNLVYTAMRRVDGARTQIFLAAYELQTFVGNAAAAPNADKPGPSGRLKWRTRLCSAPTLTGGQLDELTHLLVTLRDGRLYLNTHAGVVAAVNAADGRLLWLTKYPRAVIPADDPDRPGLHLFRDLTPAVAYKDLLVIAAADCDRVFALEAATGRLLWSLAPGEATDVVHLLGADQDRLLASGHRLYWMDVWSGRILSRFPAGGSDAAGMAAPAPRGLGRGILAERRVWFPTRETIYVFETALAATDPLAQPRLVREIPLTPRGMTGGNLVLANGLLLIANGDRLAAFAEGDTSKRAEPPQGEAPPPVE